ncbi:MAG: UMP kinase [Christensenellales bacterium]|jgi:uridylate kinase
MKYRRVLIKLSGEALSGEGRSILSSDMLSRVANVLVDFSLKGVEIAVVVGAGNIWRGKQGGHSKMEANTADHMGMLGTVINALAVKDAVNRAGAEKGVEAVVQTAVPMDAFAEPYSHRSAQKHLSEGRIVIFGCGTGSPFFTTDTAAALRAIEIGADIILMAKNVDGVYDKNPADHPDAVKYDRVTYQQTLKLNLAAADSTASALCLNNDMPMIVFELKQPENIARVLSGESLGTLVYKGIGGEE